MKGEKSQSLKKRRKRDATAIMRREESYLLQVAMVNNA